MCFVGKGEYGGWPGIDLTLDWENFRTKRSIREKVQKWLKERGLNIARNRNVIIIGSLRPILKSKFLSSGEKIMFSAHFIFPFLRGCWEFLLIYVFPFY